MEYVFTIKVKTTPDNRNVFPSERRYSASTVAGLAWIHIILAGICFVLACLAIVHPVGGGIVTHLSTQDVLTSTADRIEVIKNATVDDENPQANIKINLTDNISETANEYSYILVLAPSMLTIASLAAGTASIMASHHWYMDKNITWLFLMSILSTIVSAISFLMVIVWIANVDSTILSRFYTDKEPFEDFLVIPKDSIVERNTSHIVVESRLPVQDNKEHLVTKRVLSINILIACFIEFVWSLLSLKISYKGMRNHYKDEETNRRPPDRIKALTIIKGNKNLPAKQTPDLIQTHPKTNIQIVVTEPNHDEKFKDAESDRDHMMSYFNSSFDRDSNAETLPSIPSVVEDNIHPVEKPSRASTMSWGDSRDRPVYNQNNLDLAKIIHENITSKAENECGENVIAEAERSETCAS